MLSCTPGLSVAWFLPLQALYSLDGRLFHLVLCFHQQKGHPPEAGVQDTDRIALWK